jgi:hypothetical protein
LFPVKNISGVAKKDRHPLNINGALSDKIVKSNIVLNKKKIRERKETRIKSHQCIHKIPELWTFV